MICSKCGSNNHDNSLFCYKCGAPLKDNDVTQINNFDYGEKATPLSIVCDRCGSTDVTVYSEDWAQCNHCHSQIAINAGKKNITNVVNNVKVFANNENAFGIYAIKKTMDSKVFFRQAIIQNYSQKNVPIEFIHRNFQPVAIEYETYFVGYYNVQISYTATIGYDREEEYTEWNESTGRRETKTRTVTEWHPFNANASENFKVYRQSGVQGDDSWDAGILLEKQLNENNVQIEDYASAEFEKGQLLPPTPSDLEDAKKVAVAQLGMECENKLPGDRYRDYNYTGTAQLLALDLYSVPTYNISYKRQNKEYKISGFAFGEPKAYGDIENEEGRVYDQINERTNLLYQIAKFSALGSILLSFIFAFILSFQLVVFIGIGVSSVTVIAYLIIFAITKKRIYEERRQMKKRFMQEWLLRKRLEPLNAQESALFDK